MSMHLGRDMNELNLKYWRDGFNALFNQHEALDILSRRLVQRYRIGDPIDETIREMAELLGMPDES